MTSQLSIEDIFLESDREAQRFRWSGTFSDYLRMVIDKPKISRLSHSLTYDAIVSGGVDFTPAGQPVYGLFKDSLFGLEAPLDKVVQYFASSAQRLEVRHRVLLLLGPPASGKSTLVALVKKALESYTRTSEGSVYAIESCPMQEEPLHLIPEMLRPKLEEQYGIYIEGELCPRCRYILKTKYAGRISEMPVRRVVFSEQEAVGIGYYIATNPNPSDASLLVGSIDMSQLDGDRLEVAGKAFRLDGEFNVANRGLIEMVEIFKADQHMLATLLGLAQEQLIKMDRFGSVYADQAIIGHSNEGDFATFAADETSEALKDRIIAVQVPYNLRMSEEVKIYSKMLETSDIDKVHVAPLTLPSVSTLAVLTRLTPPIKQGMSLIEKLRLYDGQMLSNYTRQDVVLMQSHQLDEGMKGMSPRYVMNRLGSIASHPDTSCISSIAAIDSLWKGLEENVSLDQESQAKFMGFVEDSVKEYTEMAIRDVQWAYEEEFDKAASMLLGSYLNNVMDYCEKIDGKKNEARRKRDSSERDMREIERSIGVAERSKDEFRQEINGIYEAWKKKGWEFNYKSDSRLRAAIQNKLFPSRRELERALNEPRFARQKVEWARRRVVIAGRLVESCGYCKICAEDTISYVVHALKNRPVFKTPKTDVIEWLWPLHGDVTVHDPLGDSDLK